MQVGAAICWKDSVRKHFFIVVILLCLGSSTALYAFQRHTPTTRQNSTAPRIGSLSDLSALIEKLSSDVGRSVVQVFSTGYDVESEDSHPHSEVMVRQRSFGSGVLVSADGLVMTNAHVVQGGRHIKIRLSAQLDSSRMPIRKLLNAKLIAADPETDLALLKIDASGLPFLSFADSAGLKQGQLVLAFGSPLGLENSVSMGVISAANRRLSPDSPLAYVQTDAAINPGNSGGPLVDTDGRVIGINTFILTKSGGNEGVGFALPSNLVRRVLSQMRDGGHVHHHVIGVFVTTITPTLATGLSLPREEGVLIDDVIPGTPADLAGVLVGDVIMSIGGKSVQNVQQFVSDLYESSVGETIKMDVLRGHDALSLEIYVVERADDPQRLSEMVMPEEGLVQQLGVLALTIDGKVTALLPPLRRQHGVIVAARTADGTYFGDRPQVGDAIYSINGKNVEDVHSLRVRLGELQADDPVVLQVERSGRLMFLTLERD